MNLRCRTSVYALLAVLSLSGCERTVQQIKAEDPRNEIAINMTRAEVT